jgi:hypothetical protein
MRERRLKTAAKLAAWDSPRDSGFAYAALHVDMHRVIHSRVFG